MRSFTKILLFFYLIQFLPNASQCFAQTNIWTAPEKTSSYENPLKTNERIIEAGNQIYQQLCAVCHGKKGLGDGITASSLKPKPANLADDMVQDQSEGALYWKIMEGRPPMPGFKSQLSEKQVWALVVFIRSLSINQDNQKQEQP